LGQRIKEVKMAIYEFPGLQPLYPPLGLAPLTEALSPVVESLRRGHQRKVEFLTNLYLQKKRAEAEKLKWERELPFKRTFEQEKELAGIQKPYQELAAQAQLERAGKALTPEERLAEIMAKGKTAESLAQLKGRIKLYYAGKYPPETYISRLQTDYADASALEATAIAKGFTGPELESFTMAKKQIESLYDVALQKQKGISLPPTPPTKPTRSIKNPLIQKINALKPSGITEAEAKEEIRRMVARGQTNAEIQKWLGQRNLIWINPLPDIETEREVTGRTTGGVGYRIVE